MAAETAGYTVEDRHVWRDTASGGNVYRVKLQDLRDAVRNHEIDSLFVYDPDRLSRDPFDLIMVKKEIEDHGVPIRFVHGDVEAGPHGELILYVTGYVAAQELDKIRHRTMAGKRKVAEQGRMPMGDGPGLYGYGYDKTTQKRYVIPEEAEIIRRIFHEVAAGETIYSICCRLQEEGVPTKRSGEHWHVTTVIQMLKHTSYFGVDYYGRQRIRTFKTQGPEGKPKTAKVAEDKPPEEWIRIDSHSPAIISQEEYDAAHRQMKMRQPVKREGGRVNFLTGMTKCPCGGRVVANGPRYYLCRKSKSVTLYGERECTRGSLPKQKLEDLVWSIFVDWVEEPDRLISLVRDAIEVDAHHDLSEEIQAVERAMAKIADEQYKMIMYKDSLIPATHERLVAKLTADHARKEQELLSLKAIHQQQVDLPAVEDRINKACADFRQTVATMDGRDKNAALKLFGVRVIAAREGVDVLLGISESDLTISGSSTY